MEVNEAYYRVGWNEEYIPPRSGKYFKPRNIDDLMGIQLNPSIPIKLVIENPTSGWEVPKTLLKKSWILYNACKTVAPEPKNWKDNLRWSIRCKLAEWRII